MGTTAHQSTFAQYHMDAESEPSSIYLRAAACRFGPLIKRYINGSETDVNQQIEHDIHDIRIKRGVAAGLDRSHSRDYTVPHVGDPIIVLHTKGTVEWSQFLYILEKLDLPISTWDYIELPRTLPDGTGGWAPGVKTSPAERSRLDQVKDALKRTSQVNVVIESDVDIETQVTC